MCKTKVLITIRKAESVPSPLDKRNYSFSGMIYVIDSTDRGEKMAEAAEEMKQLVGYLQCDIRFLVYASKGDVAGAMNVEEVTSALAIDDIEDRPWRIKSTSLNTRAEDVFRDLDWLTGKS